MSVSPYSRACSVPGCGAAVASRGRCTAHAGQQDQQRSLGSDRQHMDLYNSAQWKRLRIRVLRENPWCKCEACVAGGFIEATRVVHHRKPHGGDPILFFDEHNLEAMAKACHDAVTGRSRGSGGFQASESLDSSKPLGR